MKEEENPQYKIILYYKYTEVKNPEALCEWNRALCQKLGLKGRIITAHEGINGTLEGTIENTEKYIDELRKIGTTEETKDMGDFSDIEIKESAGTGSAFPKLRVRARKEIVSLHLDDEDFNPKDFTGKHLPPEELREWYKEGKDFIVVDMRNEYEFRVGKFKNSINPSLENFRDLQKTLPEIEDLKDKTVVTVCTGGVRCEKASGYLLKKGFKEVYQLHGGMHKYMEKFPGKDFLGGLYTFDDRKVMNFGTDENGERIIIGECDKCKEKSENYVNCANQVCHRHFICCENCLEENGEVWCGIECKEPTNQKILQ